MGDANKNMDIASISKMLGQFEKEKMKFEMKAGVMEDAMAASAEQEDEAEDVYNQILGEVGMELTQA